MCIMSTDIAGKIQGAGGEEQEVGDDKVIVEVGDIWECGHVWWYRPDIPACWGIGHSNEQYSHHIIPPRHYVRRGA
jgi:hypothetical protein